jgi:hypothetical protein
MMKVIDVVWEKKSFTENDVNGGETTIYERMYLYISIFPSRVIKKI